MELSEVTKVIELTNKTDVNEHLDLGWKIVGFYSTAYADYPGSTQTPHFVMGWIGTDPKYPAKPDLGDPNLPW